jgi:hypothetical protein
MNDTDEIDFSPKAVRRGFFSYLPVGLVILAVVLLVGGGITFAGSQFGWWLQNQQATHTAKIISNSAGAQSADISQFENYSQQLTPAIRQAEADNAPGGQPALESQDAAEARGIGQQMCALAFKVNAPPAGMKAWESANCTAGALSTSSPLF